MTVTHSVAFRQQRTGFTLIELLVVIAIIAILAAILFPIFAKVREKARQAAGISNMSQIGLAITQYAEDNDETFPLANWGAEPLNYAFNPWNVDIAPYVKSLNVFYDPDDSGAGVPLPTGAGGGWAGFGMSYAVNGVSGWYHPPYDAPHLIGMFGYADAETAGGPDFSKYYTGSATMAALNQPSDDIELAESYTSDLQIYNATFGNSSGWGTCSVIMNFPAWSCNDGEVPPYSGNGGTESAFNSSNMDGSISHHHTSYISNFLFADGHVKSEKPYLTLTPTLNQWDISH